MFSVGLVLSAGGSVGDPWHSGAISAIAESTGWDARTADLIVGTSAGTFTATALRAGLSPADCEARFLDSPLTDVGQAVVDRIVTPYELPEIERSLAPSGPKMAARAMWPPWKVDPVRLAYGLLPDGWPATPTWLVAVRLDDGRRIVFGRDDVAGTPGQASQASSAIPAFYAPTQIGPRKYVDGAVHSSTNADLAAMLGFDLVIVSSVKTATPDARSWRRDTERTWFSTKLDDEVDAIRSRGTAVAVIEPDAEQLEMLQTDPDQRRSAACRAGRAAAQRMLATTDGLGIKSIIERGLSYTVWLVKNTHRPS